MYSSDAVVVLEPDRHSCEGLAPRLIQYIASMNMQVCLVHAAINHLVIIHKQSISVFMTVAEPPWVFYERFLIL